MSDPEKLVRALISRDRVCRLLGIDLVEITPERSVLTMTVSEDMTNGAGVCQGGIIFTLADTAMAMVASTDDEMALATTGTIDWVRSAVPGDVLTAVGTTRWRGKRPSLHDAVVTNQDGVEIAHFHGRMQRLGGTLSDYLIANPMPT
jgi:acyl-CoA thioesterase